MGKVNVLDVKVLNPVGGLEDDFSLEITFEAYENLEEDLEFKLVYVGSSKSTECDQILDSILVGPIPCGTHKFVFEAPHPDWSRIDKSEVLGHTVIFLSCLYKDREFCRIGYHVYNEYATEGEQEQQQQQQVRDVVFEKVQRSIFVDCPRVTIFPIKWVDDITEEQAVDDFTYDMKMAGGLQSDVKEEENVEEDEENEEEDEEEDEEDEDEDEEEQDDEEDIENTDEEDDELKNTTEQNVE